MHEGIVIASPPCVASSEADRLRSAAPLPKGKAMAPRRLCSRGLRTVGDAGPYSGWGEMRSCGRGVIASPSCAALSVTNVGDTGATFPKGEGNGAPAFMWRLSPQRERERVVRT